MADKVGMELNTNKMADGRTITTLEVTRLHCREGAERLASKLRGYMIDDVVVAPFQGGFHVSVTSTHEDAPAELAGFVMMVLAGAVAGY